MRFRKLRIAWSVLCGLACVLLIAVWVRSYGREGIHYFRGTFCRTQSSNGKFSFEYFRPEYSLDKSTNRLQPINGFCGGKYAPMAFVSWVERILQLWAVQN